MRSQVIQKVNETINCKSIPEAMSEEINNIVNSPTIIVSLLIPLGESDFKKVLKQLQGDRSQIAHGRGNEVENIEKKITFLHGLVYAILTKIFTKDRS